MRSSSLLYLLELFAIVFGAMFINPPIPDSAGIFVIANPVAATGSHMTVQWSLEPEEQIDPLTLYMYQDFAGGGVWDPISEMSANTTTLEWTVGTDHSLSVSHAFYFNLWLENANESIATSHDFNITSDESPSTTATSSSPASSSSPPSDSTSVVSSTSPGTTTSIVSSTSTLSTPSPISTTSPASSSSSHSKPSASSSTEGLPINILTTSTFSAHTFPGTTSGTSTASSSSSASTSSTANLVPASASLGIGVKIRLGLGIPAVAILALTAGWFIFAARRHNRDAMSSSQGRNPQIEKSTPYAETSSGYVEFTSLIAGRHEVG